MANNGATAQLKECPVCHDVYNTGANLPKVFACGHSVCAVCVPSCIRQRRATCPLCRQETPVPASGLPTNFDLKDVIESTEAARVLADVECSACHRNVPSSECFACKTCSGDEMISVCALCAMEAHREHSVFKHDTLVSLEQIVTVRQKILAYSRAYHRSSSNSERVLTDLCKNFPENPYVGLWQEFDFPSFLTKEQCERRGSALEGQSSKLKRAFDDIERAVANFRQEVMRIRVDEQQPSTSQIGQPAASNASKRGSIADSEGSDEESSRSRARSRKPACPKRSKYF